MIPAKLVVMTVVCPTAQLAPVSDTVAIEPVALLTARVGRVPHVPVTVKSTAAIEVPLMVSGKVIVTDVGIAFRVPVNGLYVAVVNPVLSTVKVALALEVPAELLAASVAVLAAMEMPTVPFPVHPLRLTVGVLVVPLVTVVVVQVAPPVVLRVTLDASRLIVEAPA